MGTDQGRWYDELIRDYDKAEEEAKDEIKRKYPALLMYKEAQDEFLRKSEQLKNLRSEFKELDSKSDELTDGKDQSTPEPIKTDLLHSLKMSKTRIFEKEKIIEQEMKRLGLEIESLKDKVAVEMAKLAEEAKITLGDGLES